MKTENNNTAIQRANSQDNMPVVFNFFDPSQFEVMQRVSKMFAMSELVPDIYKVSEKNPIEKAMANCMIAIDMSSRIGASPLMIMQNMYIVYGKPSWSSKFLIATVNTCGRFDPLKYKMKSLGKVGKINGVEYDVDNIECIAYTCAKGSDEVLESSPVSIEMAIKEGWYTKNGSKWKTITKQMLIYRAASFWTSAYAPEISMGMRTTEEVLDIEDIPYEDVTNKIANNANKNTVDFEATKETPTEEPKKEEPKQEEKKEPEEKKAEDKTAQPGKPKLDF